MPSSHLKTLTFCPPQPLKMCCFLSPGGEARQAEHNGDQQGHDDGSHGFIQEKDGMVTTAKCACVCSFSLSRSAYGGRGKEVGAGASDESMGINQANTKS